MSRQTELANAFQVWAQKMGYVFGPNSPPQEFFERLCSGERAPAIRHLMEYVRPAEEMRKVRKYMLLQELKAQSKNKRIEKKHVESLQKLLEATSSQVTAEAESLKQLSSEREEITRSAGKSWQKLDAFSTIRKELEGLLSIKKTAEDLSEMVAATEHLGTNPGCSNADIHQAEAMLKEMLNTSAAAGVGECKKSVSKPADSRLEKNIAEAMEWIPAPLMFQAFMQEMETTVAQMADLNRRISVDFNFTHSLCDSTCFDAQVMGTVVKLRAMKQKSKLRQLKEQFQEAFNKALDLYTQSAMNDSQVVSQLEAGGENVNTAVETWLRNKVEGVRTSASVKEYNRLVTQMDETLRTESASMADAAAYSNRLTSLINEKLNSVSHYGSEQCAKFVTQLERNKAEIVKSAISVRSMLDSTEPVLSLRRGIIDPGSGEAGSVTGEPEKEVVRYPEQRWDIADHHQVSNVLRKLMTSYSLESDTFIRVFDISRAGVNALPTLDELKARRKKNRQASSQKLDRLIKYQERLTEKFQNNESAVNFWIDQPFENQLADFPVGEEGKTYSQLKQEATDALKKIKTIERLRKQPQQTNN